MIIKSLSRTTDSSSQLVQYIFKYFFKDKNESNEQLITPESNSKFIIRHNIRARSSIKGFIKEFQENESYRLVRRKDSVKIFHTIISFSNKDKSFISDTLLKNIAKKFIQERGENNLYLGTKHEDKDHIHLHIAVSGTQLNGRSSRVSKQKFHSIKLALDKYQREVYTTELSNSLPEHGKAKRMRRESVLQTIQSKRQTDKEKILESLQNAYGTSKSKNEFVRQLTDSGHEPYYRAGRLQGVKVNGLKYRFSRLGFEDAVLEALDREANYDVQTSRLTELQSIRGKVFRRDIARTGEKIVQDDSVLENEKGLKELDTLRSRAKSKENGLMIDEVQRENFEIDEDTLPSLQNLTKLRNSVVFEQPLPA